MCCRWPVMQCHSTLEDHMSGEPVRNRYYSMLLWPHTCSLPAHNISHCCCCRGRSADLSRLLHYAHWAHAAYQDINDRSTLVASLGIQVCEECAEDMLEVHASTRSTMTTPCLVALLMYNRSRTCCQSSWEQAPQEHPPATSYH
jgi:hypothetical protein